MYEVIVEFYQEKKRIELHQDKLSFKAALQFLEGINKNQNIHFCVIQKERHIDNVTV